MIEPERFAVIRLSRPPVALERPRIALLSSLAGFFIPAVAQQR
jgi:hypothetical protein